LSASRGLRHKPPRETRRLTLSPPAPALRIPC
jgi:hypothetical protein